MTVIPAFRNITEKPEPWTADICDLIRTRWQASIPRELRRRRIDPTPVCNLERGTATLLERAAAHRAELAKVILPLHEAGTTVPKLAIAAGCSEGTVRRIIRENGEEPNVPVRGGVKNRDWAALMPATQEMRKQGMTWLAIGKQLGVCRNRLREYFDWWEAQQ